MKLMQHKNSKQQDKFTEDNLRQTFLTTQPDFIHINNNIMSSGIIENRLSKFIEQDQAKNVNNEDIQSQSDVYSEDFEQDQNSKIVKKADQYSYNLLLKQFEEQTDKNLKNINSYNFQLNSEIVGISEKVNLVIQKQQQEFLRGYQVWVQKQEAIVQELIDQLKKKLSFKDRKDKKLEELIIRLKQTEEHSLNKDKRILELIGKNKDYKEICKTLKLDIHQYKQTALGDLKKIKLIEQENIELKEQIRQLIGVQRDSQSYKELQRVQDISFNNQKEVLQDLQLDFMDITDLSNIVTVNNYENHRGSHQQILNEGNMSKFTNFINDIMLSQLSKASIKDELVKYFKAIDQGYRQIIVKQAGEIKKLKEFRNRKNGQNLNNSTLSKQSSKISFSGQFSPLRVGSVMLEEITPIIKVEDQIQNKQTLPLTNITPLSFLQNDNEKVDYLTKIQNTTSKRNISINSSALDYKSYQSVSTSKHHYNHHQSLNKKLQDLSHFTSNLLNQKNKSSLASQEIKHSTHR
eukprot:403332068